MSIQLHSILLGEYYHIACISFINDSELMQKCCQYRGKIHSPFKDWDSCTQGCQMSSYMEAKPAAKTGKTGWKPQSNGAAVINTPAPAKLHTRIKVSCTSIQGQANVRSRTQTFKYSKLSRFFSWEKALSEVPLLPHGGSQTRHNRWMSFYCGHSF